MSFKNLSDFLLFLDNFRMVQEGIIDEYSVELDAFDDRLFQILLAILNYFDIDYSFFVENNKRILVARKKYEQI